MDVFLANLKVQECSHLFIQGDTQRKFGCSEVYTSYTNGSKNKNLFYNFVKGVSIHLVEEDISSILNKTIVG